MIHFCPRPLLLGCALLAAPLSAANAVTKPLNHKLDAPLGDAIVHGKTDEVKKLLDRGADPNAVSEDDSKTPMLTLAAAVDIPVDITKLLITAGANLEAVTTRGDSALGVAAMKGHVDVANLLVKSGAKLEANQDLGLTPLIFAAATGHTDVVQALIKAGANVNARAHDGGSALVYNSTKTDAGAGNLEIAKMLVEAGADVSDEVGKVDAKALAEKNGMTDIASYLQTIVRRDEDLLQAVSAGQWDEAKKMMANGANPRYQTRFYDGEGDDVGRVATAALAMDATKPDFNAEIALQVLKHSELEITTDDGETALTETVNSPYPDLVKANLLLKAGANPNATGKDGVTALIQAAKRGDLPSAKLLLANKADVNAIAKDGKTALMWAADSGSLAMTKTLLDAGAKTDIKTPVGETALSLAQAGTKKGYVFGAEFNKIIALLQPDEELPGLDELTK